MPYATAKDGTRIYYKDWGQGRPVVLVHGWPLTSDTFDDAALALAEKGFRAIAHDRRGFGRSDQPWAGYDYDTFADDVAAVLDDAESRPAGRARRLLDGRRRGRPLPCPPQGAPGQPRDTDRLGRALICSRPADHPDGVPKDVFDGIIAGIRADRADFFRGFFKDFFGASFLAKSVSEAVLDDAWRQAMNAGLWPTVACVRAFSETDFRPDLAAFTMPTLVIHGVEDHTVPIALTARDRRQGGRRAPSSSNMTTPRTACSPATRSG